MKLLLYCTKAKPYLYKTDDTMIEKMNGDYHTQLNEAVLTENLNGKIVAECDFEVEYLRIVDDDPLGAYWYETKTLSENEVLEKSCLTGDELFDYLGEDNEGYAIHIKNLHVFNEPRDLEDYEDEWEYPLERAPQNMRRCYSTLYSNIEADMPIRTDSYILISIRPEWLCKILNRKKTIEVRKKVLKEMLE